MKKIHENLLQISLLFFVISFITRNNSITSNILFCCSILAIFIKIILNIKYWFNPYDIREIKYINNLIDGNYIPDKYKILLKNHINNINDYFIPYIKSLKFLENSNFDKNEIEMNMNEKLNLIKKTFRNNSDNDIKDFFEIFNRKIENTNIKISKSIKAVLNENNLYYRKKMFKRMFVECFIDFIIVFSASIDEHISHTRNKDYLVQLEIHNTLRYNSLVETNNYLEKLL